MRRRAKVAAITRDRRRGAAPGRIARRPDAELATAGALEYAGLADQSGSIALASQQTLLPRKPAQVSKQPANVPDFSKGDGLIPAIAQDAETGEVLMLGFMNAESYAETLARGQAVYFSRSRNRLWHKGEESGHVQDVEAVLVDCDGDTILLKVRQRGGAACHQGYRSCFFRQVTPEGLKTIAQPVFDPDQVYKTTP
jgi:phosphoribosyl-AMP cyclohydrolase